MTICFPLMITVQKNSIYISIRTIHLNKSLDYLITGWQTGFFDSPGRAAMDTSTPENVLQTQNDMQGLAGNCHRSLLIIGHLSGILIVNRHGMCKEEKYTAIYGGLKDLRYLCMCKANAMLCLFLLIQAWFSGIFEFQSCK